MSAPDAYCLAHMASLGHAFSPIASCCPKSGGLVGQPRLTTLALSPLSPPQVPVTARTPCRENTKEWRDEVQIPKHRDFRSSAGANTHLTDFLRSLRSLVTSPYPLGSLGGLTFAVSPVSALLEIFSGTGDPVASVYTIEVGDPPTITPRTLSTSEGRDFRVAH